MRKFEVEIWIERYKYGLIYEITASSFENAYKRARKTMKEHEARGKTCILIKLEEIK